VCDMTGTKTKGMVQDRFGKFVSPDSDQLVHNHDDTSFQNKGSPTTTMEDLENTTRDAVGIDTNHPTRLLSLEYGFSKAQDDDSNYEREASKQMEKSP